MLTTLKVQSHFGNPNIHFAIVFYLKPGSKGLLLWTLQYRFCNKVNMILYDTRETMWWEVFHWEKDRSSPQAVPRVDLAKIHVVLLAGVEHKLSFMGAIFLWKTRQDKTRGSDKAAVTDNCRGYSGETPSQKQCSCLLTKDHGNCERNSALCRPLTCPLLFFFTRLPYHKAVIDDWKIEKNFGAWLKTNKQFHSW